MFDNAICIGVLTLINPGYWNAVLKEAARVVRGKIIMKIHNKKRFGDYVRTENYEIFPVDRNEIVNVLENNGFIKHASEK